MDLTKNSPRSSSETMLGIVQLARATDKAKAVAQHTIGEYRYDCPMDQTLFEYLGMNSKEYLKVVSDAKSDYEIEAYAKTFVSRKDPRNIEAFNKKFLTTRPSGDAWKHFEELRDKVAPQRTDVFAWADLLDLEEGRTVPTRETVLA
jgi:predicted HD phosphohydrolase